MQCERRVATSMKSGHYIKKAGGEVKKSDRSKPESQKVRNRKVRKSESQKEESQEVKKVKKRKSRSQESQELLVSHAVSFACETNNIKKHLKTKVF